MWNFSTEVDDELSASLENIKILPDKKFTKYSHFQSDISAPCLAAFYGDKCYICNAVDGQLWMGF